MQLTNLPDLSVKELAAVVAIAECGSFIAASRLLNVSLPTLSRTVKRVEKVVGVSLFERSTRRVVITPAGRAFVGIAERLLSELQLSIEDLDDVAAEQRGQVVVAAFSTFAHEMLPPIVGEYLKSRPDIQLHVRQGLSPDIVDDIVEGRADFGITYVYTLPDTVHRIDLRKEPIYVVMPHDHPLGRRDQTHVTLADLSGVPLVSLPPDTHVRRLIDGEAASASVWLKHSVVVPSFLDILNHVGAGVGVGLVPSGVISDRFLTRMKARSLQQPQMALSVGLIALKGRHITPAASSLMRLLLEKVQTQQTALRTEFFSSSLAALEGLPHGPYELLWRRANATDADRTGPRGRGRLRTKRRGVAR